MQDDDFEWDDDKAAANDAKHGISFEIARHAFSDAFAIAREDRLRSHGEERYILIGMVENRLIAVAYTYRGARIRIISARGAEPYEKRSYHEENARNS